jgi:flagellar basal-body rod protein FlgF
MGALLMGAKHMRSTDLVLLSNQMALERSVDIIANNIANSSTTGFKRQGIEFNTYLTSGNQSSGQATSFVYDRATFRDTSVGVITNTGNPLDLALQKEGYFQVQTAQGTQYTRDGAFRTNNQGQIVTSTGLPVLSESGQPITVPEDSSDLTVYSDGFVTVKSGTGSARTSLGRIGVVKFDNDNQLTPVSGTLLTTTQAPVPVTDSIITQGAIEESNAKPVVEITELIRIQRAYEQATNFISQDNTRLTSAIDKLSATT